MLQHVINLMKIILNQIKTHCLYVRYTVGNTGRACKMDSIAIPRVVTFVPNRTWATLLDTALFSSASTQFNDILPFGTQLTLYILSRGVYVRMNFFIKRYFGLWSDIIWFHWTVWSFLISIWFFSSRRYCDTSPSTVIR